MASGQQRLQDDDDDDDDDEGPSLGVVGREEGLHGYHNSKGPFR